MEAILPHCADPSASNGGWPRACARAGVHHPQYDGRHHDRLGPSHGLPGLRHAPPAVGIPGDVQMPISARAPRRSAGTSWCWPRIPAGPPGSSHLQGGQTLLKRCIRRKSGGAPQNIEHCPVQGPAAARLLRHQCLRGSAGKLRTVRCFMHRSSHSRTTWYEWIKISQRRVVGVFLPPRRGWSSAARWWCCSPSGPPTGSGVRARGLPIARRSTTSSRLSWWPHGRRQLRRSVGWRPPTCSPRSTATWVVPHTFRDGFCDDEY